MRGDPFDLDRFLVAQAQDYPRAIAELRTGEKRSHWIWFVFPQLQGLGSSAASRHFGLSGIAEARAYLAHPVLGFRLRESFAAMLGHAGATARQVLGELDAAKFRSCLTLFLQAAPGDDVFAHALEHFFKGEPDPMTLALLERRPTS
jgi:uncharacterized protein (DUF1810 family)